MIPVDLRYIASTLIPPLKDTLSEVSSCNEPPRAELLILPADNPPPSEVLPTRMRLLLSIIKVVSTALKLFATASQSPCVEPSFVAQTYRTLSSLSYA